MVYVYVLLIAVAVDVAILAVVAYVSVQVGRAKLRHMLRSPGGGLNIPPITTSSNRERNAA